MKILSIEHALPARRITNDWVLEQVRIHNRETLSPSELELVEARLTRFLASAGTEVRYAVEKDERALDLCLNAGRAALATAGVGPNEIDFVLYVGVCRGWTEPAMANVVKPSSASATPPASIVDACASWLRALHVAHAYLRGGIYRRGLIVNCECAFVPYQDWTLATVDELDYRAAGWTAGEAATATVVSDDITDDDFYFTFKNFGEHYALCMFPLAMAPQFGTDAVDERHAPMRFFAQSHELLGVTSRKVIETYKADPVLQHRQHDIGFGHEASKKAVQLIARQLGLPYDHYVSTHARFGNTVSASVPLGMSIASKEGRLHRGDRVLVLVGASGITVGLASFTF
jgi:3-oxoacyl-[acyl-carrier-protein] synthase III